MSIILRKALLYSFLSAAVLFMAAAFTENKAYSQDVIGQASQAASLKAGTDLKYSSDASGPGFVDDEKPRLNVEEPGSVITVDAPFRLRANAADDSGKLPDLKAYILYGNRDNVVATGSGSIDQTVDLSEYNGKNVILQISATDSAGQRSFKNIEVFVEYSHFLTRVANIDEQISDFDDGCILFKKSDYDYGESRLTIRDRASGRETVVSEHVYTVRNNEYLTPNGAVYSQEGSPSPADNGIYDYNDDSGELHKLSSDTQLRVSGKYAIFNSEGRLILRDLSTGKNTTVYEHTTDGRQFMHDLTPNGEVALEERNVSGAVQVFLYRQGVLKRITVNYPYNQYAPLTDGTNVVYEKRSGSESWIVLNHNGEDVELASFGGRDIAPYKQYQVNNEWVAYAKPGSEGVAQVWLRSPDGQQAQVSHFNSDSAVDSLSPEGDITFTNGDQLYRLGAGMEEPAKISSTLGKRVWMNGLLYSVVGSAIFQVGDKPDAPELTSISVDSNGYDLEIGEMHITKVYAHFSDNSVKDVTSDSAIEAPSSYYARVEDSGAVKAFRPGKVKINVRYLYETTVITVNVVAAVDKPIPPTGLAAQAVSGSEILLEWNEVPNAAFYRVERALSQSGPFTVIIQFEALKTSFLDERLSPDTTYWYRVKSDRYMLPSAPSEAVSATTRGTGEPNSLTRVTTNPEQYSLNIGELQYIKVQAHYSDQTVKDVTDNAEFVTSDAKVAAVSRGGKVEALGEGEAVITVRYGGKTAQVAVSVAKRGLELAPPVWVDALLIGNHHMFLIWYGVPGATAYNIYRAESEDGVYTKIATLADTIYLDSSLRAGTTSRYKVTAVLESEPSDSISAATASPQR